jgi:rubrerythrin
MNEQMENLLYEALETEIGGVQVYTNAVRCAQNEDLKEEWEKYLEQTMRHEQILRDVLETLGMDPEKETPGRKVVRHIGESLVQAMQMAREEGEPEAAQIVAAECVVHAETKDHQNWELLGEIAKKLTGEEKKAITEAHDEVEDEEDEHLYHTMGWSRELWLDHLGMAAVLPPPEEKKDVKTAIGAARAKSARKTMVRGGRKGRSAPAEH